MWRKPNLFFIFHEKPTSPGSEYFLLNHTVADSDSNADPTRALTVVPPLPFKGPLYLCLTPRTSVTMFRDSSTYNAENYQLDPASLVRFLQALDAAGPSIPGTRETGGEDEPAPSWDTWSGDSPREALGALVGRREVFFVFDLVPFESVTDDSLEIRVINELALLRQLTLDYTWKGCELTKDYIVSMREVLPRLLASSQTSRSPILPSSRSDSCVDALRPCTAYLQSLPAIHDDDPRVDEESDDELSDAWVDEDDMSGMRLAAAVHAKKAEDVKMIAIDLNLLIDRDDALQKTLISVFPPSEYHFAAKELLNLYIET